MCGVKSWPSTKERKYSFVPTNLPSYIRDSLSISVPSYITQNITSLDPEVAMEIRRHCTSYGSAFATRQKMSPYTETNTLNLLPENIKIEPWLQEKEVDETQSDVHNDSEDTMSDTTLSTLSGAEAVFESADEDEWDVYLDNDFSDLKKLLEETNLDKETCEKILIQVKLLIVKNRNSLHNALYSKKIVQKELEKLRIARRIKINKIQKDKKNLHQEMEKIKNEFKERLSEMKDTKDTIDWEHQNKEIEKSNNSNPDYLHLLSQNEYLQKQVFSLQREIDKMKDYLTESSVTTPEENENKAVGDVSSSLTTTASSPTPTTTTTTTISTESTEKSSTEASIK
ncbi:uncharacterized protein LOC111641908 [Centruroides sculpturatus]|uniref:uncharacterized protein LOC111641908 n=1 Tax=Centruroides sculpturatus TaxID=218467 RepID=UPI000C6E68D6|nr:uncharacterized protein LOC111641908 [Centruroides sculpturatus]